MQMVKLLLKLAWLGFGLFGVVTVGQKFWPSLERSDLIQGVQSALVDSLEDGVSVDDLKSLNSDEVSQVLGETIKTQVVKILESTSEQITAFPAKQVKKIKIGACEELLEEDICSVAKEIECQ